MINFSILIYCSRELSGLKKTLNSLRDATETLNTVVLLDVHPYELNPSDFILFLEESKRGTEFIKIGDSNTLQQEEPWILLQAGQQLTLDAMWYITYFFEDSNCPIVFIPAIGKLETLPEELQNLPTGGITDEFSLLLKYNFVCGVKDQATFKIDYGLVPKTIQIANDIGHFGIINTVSCVAKDSVFRKFTAGDLPNNIPCSLKRYISEHIIEQLDTPIEQAIEGLDLLLPYISSEYVTGKEPLPLIRITEAYNYYNDVEIKGYYYQQSHGLGLKIKAKTDIKLFEVNRVMETVADELIPRYLFRCRLTLADYKTKIMFSEGSKNIPADKIVLCTEGNYDLSLKKKEVTIKKFAMRPYYTVSVIIPVYNAASYLKESVESIVCGTLDFFPNIQIILVNDGSTDESLLICEELARKYSYNICFVQQKHKGVSAARNVGLAYAVGKYIFFLDADDTVDSKLLQLGVKNLESHQDIDFVTFPLKLFGTGKFPKPDLNFRFLKNGVVDIQIEPQKVQFSACGVLMRRDAVKGLTFNERLSVAEDAEFMHRALMQKGKYFACKDAFYNYRMRNFYREDKDMANSLFVKAVSDYYVSESSKEISSYAQHLILQDLRRIVLGDKLLSGSGIDISHILMFIEDEVILNARKYSRWHKEYLLCQKHGTIRVSDGPNAAFYAGGCKIKGFSADIKIDYLRQTSEFLSINGYFELPTYENVTVVADFNIEDSTEYTAILFKDQRQVNNGRSFEIKIPLSKIQNDEEIVLRIKHGDTYGPVSLSFPNSFLFIGKKVIASQGKHGIQVLAFSQDKLAELLKGYKGSGPMGSKKLADEYLTMYPFLGGNRIWLFVGESANGVSRPDKSAVTHLYEYCMDKNDGIEKHLIVADEVNTKDGQLVYGSETYTLMCLFAEKIIISDVKELIRLQEMQGITAQIIFLPNDVLTEKDRSDLKILNGMPIEMISLISEQEKEILPIGKARNSSLVVGNPKYDNLLDTLQNQETSQRQPRLLFMPDSRKHLNLNEKKFNPEFRDSKYAVTISDLLLDEQLLDTADALGIQIAFAPHEKVFLYLSDFEMDESIKIIPPSLSCFELCKNADMLVTDKLPAHGFAYLNKPVVYFQFDDDGTLPQDNARFGKCVEDFEELINLLVEYMQTEFSMKPEHKADCEYFFPSRDGLSSERIYKLLLEVTQDD